MHDLELSRVVRQLRLEIQASSDDRREKAAQFAIDDAEVELQFYAASDANADGKVTFWVSNGTVSDSTESPRLHRLKLKLRPIGPDGDPIRLGSHGKRPKKKRRS